MAPLPTQLTTENGSPYHHSPLLIHCTPKKPPQLSETTSPCVSPLPSFQQILVMFASQNSQLCLLHSGPPLGSVCFQSPRAIACKLYPGKKLEEMGNLRALHVSFPFSGITGLCCLWCREVKHNNCFGLQIFRWESKSGSCKSIMARGMMV